MKKINKYANSWSSSSVVSYYLSNRDKDKDLYRSEKVFIKDALRKKHTLLDIGCAAGGFRNIVKGYNPRIEYSGVDISPVMIEEAKKRFPQERFYVTDGNRLSFPDSFFEVVICFGVLHMTENWKTLLSEAWRVCKDSLLFDLRITDAEGISDIRTSYQKLQFEGAWDGVSIAPYIVVNIDDFMQYLLGVKPSISMTKAYGYMHPVSPMTVSCYREVCMAALWLSKTGKNTMQITEWNMPLNPARKIFRNLLPQKD